MDAVWLFGRFNFRFQWLFIIVLSYQKLCLCSTLNEEGLALLKVRERIVVDPFAALSNWSGENGDVNPCSWYGVNCSEGKVVVLNLRDLCLRGTLASDFRSLLHLKAIFLRNNSFNGSIPEEIGELKELEILDLGHNNFRGKVPVNLGRSQFLTKLLLDNNGELYCSNPEIGELKKVSELQEDEKKLAAESPSCNIRFNTRYGGTELAFTIYQTNAFVCARNLVVTEYSGDRRLLVSDNRTGSINPRDLKNKNLTKPSNNATWRSYRPSPPPKPLQTPSLSPLSPIPSKSPPPTTSNPSFTPVNKLAIVAGVVGGFIFLGFAVIGFLFWKTIGGTSIKPWATGVCGRLEKAFVAGVPKFYRSELETACEDFSNVITSSPRVSIYKGILSSGVEIAVTSVAAKSSSQWSMKLEEQFREKVLTLSKMNHKNFNNLLGFCEEEDPFTRMMVFEYAPNGTLFEHLHVKEAEHLDWRMRLRIALGMANCLEHMHQLNPPIAHTNFNSTAVALSEDYAAKVSDFSFFSDSSDEPLQSLETDVYNFGVTLFEIVTGRIPYTFDTSCRGDWASVYLKGGGKNLREVVDPTLRTFQEEQLEAIDHVIKTCVCPNLSVRPTMKGVAERLKEINMVLPDRTNLGHSALWWAEAEIQSEENKV